MKAGAVCCLIICLFYFLAPAPLFAAPALKKSSEFKNLMVRVPAVAGTFYPKNPEELRSAIDKYLTKAKIPQTSALLKAIMVPHAGYEYSGGVAAYAYKALEGKNIKTVVLLGNAHAMYFKGIAIDKADVWQTPLGTVEIDKTFAQNLAKENKNISFSQAAHAKDHILEVQIPFLQTVLKNKFKIVPILFGQTDEKASLGLAQTLSKLLGPQDLLIASSDLSHYPEAEEAKVIDEKTLSFIQRKDAKALEHHIALTMAAKVPNEQTVLCGPLGVETLISLAQKLSWQGRVLKYGHSGETTKDASSVVGYGAIAFYQGETPPLKASAFTSASQLNKKQQATLLSIAKTTVEQYVNNKIIPQFTITDPELLRPQGAFVTLRKNHGLRGCIGQILPNKNPLWQVVRDMAAEAAAYDPRFLPVQKKELPLISYEVSVLSAPEEIKDWTSIKLGIHGVIVRKNSQSGVFLPQVAQETGWTLEEFLSNLCNSKAGLPFDCYKYDPEVKLSVFTAQVF